MEMQLAEQLSNEISTLSTLDNVCIIVGTLAFASFMLVLLSRKKKKK